MAKSFLIVDGYNLMHAVGLARKKYGPGDLERSRTRLLKYLLSHLTSEERNRTTIVFDARNPPPGVSRKMNLHGMCILFAESNSDADTLIEELITGHSSPRQLRIISSDHRLQQAARRRRGSWVDSEDYAEELERRSSGSKRQAKPADLENLQQLKNTGRLSPEETQAWMEEFGEVVADGQTVPHDDAQIVPDEMDRLQSEIDELLKDDDWLENKHP